MEPFFVPEAVLRRHLTRLAEAEGDGRWPVLEALCALHRLDALGAVVGARHGWLGASFSATEILAVLYHLHVRDPRLPLDERPAVLLSKGHAAPAQYAILSALGAFPRERLGAYLEPGGLPAHSDRRVPAVDAASGSLGQGLSKAVGLALARRRRSVPHACFAVLGDGELQEGQVFEALLSLRAHGLARCVPIVDRNGLQTDSDTADVKDARDWAAVLAGVGLEAETVDGHDVRALHGAIVRRLSSDVPGVVIAETVKGQGSRVTAMPRPVGRRQGRWHGRVPDEAEHRAIVEELAGGVADPELAEAVAGHFRREAAAVAVPAPPAVPSTGTAFGAALAEAAEDFPELVVLDADLESACRLTTFAGRHPDRFLECGISEQDMVSTAVGLALGGLLPVANTYASFHRRALDQIADAAAEGLPLVLAGHYAGLDYFMDGRTHQSLGDVAHLRALGGVDVFEPLTPEETGQVLLWLLRRARAERAEGRPSRPAYVRLHRTPAPRSPGLPHAFEPGVPYRFPPAVPALARLLVAGPHMLALALEVQERAGRACPVEVVAVSTLSAASPLVPLCGGHPVLLTLESHVEAGGLGDLVSSVSRLAPVRLAARPGLEGTRTLERTMEMQGMTAADVLARVRAEAQRAGAAR